MVYITLVLYFNTVITAVQNAVADLYGLVLVAFLDHRCDG